LSAKQLLQSNFCSLCLQFGLQLLSLSLGYALFQNLRSAVYNSLSLFQSQTSCLTNNFDNFNFVRSNICQLYVKLVFLLSGLSSSACCCYNNACCCRYAKLLLTSFYQLVQL